MEYTTTQHGGPKNFHLIPVVITAAGLPRPQVLALSSEIKSATMVPVSGKPVLGWILDDLIYQGFRVFIVLSIMEDEQINEYCEWRYKDEVQIRTIPVESVNSPKGVGHSIFKGLSRLNHYDLYNYNISDDVLIVLGHTIYHEDIAQTRGFSYDWVMVSDVQGETTRWCYAVPDETGDLEKLIDKPSSPELCQGMPALVGVYYLKQRNKLIDCLRESNNHNLTEALEKYNAFNKIRIEKISSSDWLDCGSIAGLQKTRKTLITKNARASNLIDLDEKFGVLTKHTSKSTEMLQQYLWYLGVPDEIKSLTPRIHSFKPATTKISYSAITMEYYAYSTLEEAWLYKELPFEVWQSVLDHLFEVLSKFHEFPADLSSDDFSVMYKTKTERRLEKLRDQKTSNRYPTWNELLDNNIIVINNRSLLGWKALEQKVWRECDLLYNEKHSCLIHGDFHLGNILYDLNTRLIKLIDPRGGFGSSTIYGDIKYDLAKLRHSICGGYNYIVNDLFSVDLPTNQDSIHIRFFRPHLRIDENQKFSVQQEVAKFLDLQIDKLGKELNSPNLLRQVKLIEGLLFLSMIPIHYDFPHRQLAMLSIAIEQFNELLNVQ